MERRFVVVGAGLAGMAAVQTLREEGFEGRLTLVGEESHLPYERPPLSKEYLRGEQERDSLFVQPEAWFEEHGVEALLGMRATSLDTDARTVALSDGGRLRYDALLIAAGGRPRTLAPPSERVRYLRTIEDADRIHGFLGGGKHVLIVGAGFIGSEVAATARTLGTEVTILDVFDVPLQRALGRDIGGVFGDLHRDHGVHLRMGDPVSSIEERAASVVVRTESGVAVEGDAAVVGIAITPNDELAAEAGLEVSDGILVDAFCRTSAAGVFAAGDVANHLHPLFERRLRVEHYDNALKHGAHAARSMLGKAEAFDDPHWFWSDQYDVSLQSAGVADEREEVVVRGSLYERSFVAFYLSDGRLRGAVGMNRGHDVRRAMKLIRQRVRPDPASLRDEEVDLRSLAARE